jgi:predicted metalloendopeptidase
MINNLHAEFKRTLTEVDWMDSESKKSATEKANAIDIKIGYPDFTYNDTFIDGIYKDVGLWPINSFVICI